MSRRGWTVVSVLALLVSLAAWGWFATEQARVGWWDLGQHSAVEPDEQGWAHLESLGVRLVGVEQVTEVEDEQPPAGYAYLRVDLEVSTEPARQDSPGDAEDATAEETLAPLGACEVQIRDTAGRLFVAAQEVPRGEEFESSLRCGSTDPEDPVPTDQSLLVLVPDDAEPASVRVDSRDFPPATFIELPLPS